MTRILANKYSFSGAFILALLCLLGFFKVSSSINARYANANLIPKSQIKNKKDYAVYLNNNCIAELKTNFEESAEQIAFIIRGDLLAQLKQTLIPIQISGFAQFNSIKQLSGAMLYIRSSEQELKFQSDGITPVKLKVTTNKPNIRELFSHTLKGPILLVDHDAQHYRLTDASGESNKLLALGNQFNQTASFGKAIKITEGSCPEAKITPFALDQFIALSNNIEALLSKQSIESYVKSITTN